MSLVPGVVLFPFVGFGLGVGEKGMDVLPESRMILCVRLRLLDGPEPVHSPAHTRKPQAPLADVPGDARVFPARFFHPSPSVSRASWPLPCSFPPRLVL